MRDRLVATFVGLTLLVLALFALPAAYVVADVVQDQEQTRADRTVALVAAALDDRLAAGRTVDPAYLATLLQPGERLVYTAADGTSAVAGDVADARLRSTESLEGGGTVTIGWSQRSVADQVADEVLPLAVLALVLACAAGVLGTAVARRLARPFGELTDVAAAIGSGRFETPVPRFGVREADELGRTLGETAGRLDVLVRRERAFAVEASHELRTPITALRLSLEDLTLWKGVPADVAAELERAIGEVDRLGDAVSRLLQERRVDALEAEVEVDLRSLVEDVAEPWRTRLADLGRDLLLRPGPAVVARAAVQPVRQVLEALLDHATVHGDGTVVVDLAVRRTVLRVRVGDEGARRVASGILHGDDADTRAAGLADAADAAESVGGYLTAEDGARSRLSLVLPHRPA